MDELKISSGENYPYVSPTPWDIPFIVVEGFDQEKENRISSKEELISYMQKEIADITECGFNASVRIIPPPPTDILEINRTNLLGQYIPANLSIVGEPFIYKEDDMTTALYLNAFRKIQNGIRNLTINCWTLKDEPTYNKLDKWASRYKYIMQQTLSQNDMLILNLSGEESKGNVGELDEKHVRPYPEYLSIIEEKFKPGVWSFDLYPVILKNGLLVEINNDFYTRLEQFAAISKSTGRPFWTCIACLQFTLYNIQNPNNPQTIHQLAVPNVARMRFAVFSALAFGVQGFIF